MRRRRDRTPDAVVERAVRLVVEGREDESRALLENAVSRFPEDPDIRIQYATALLVMLPEQAASEVMRAIELSPDDPVLLTRAANLLLGLGHRDAARDCAEHAIEVAPADFAFVADLMNVTGLLTALRGDYELAEEALRAAADAEPDRWTFASDLAKFLVDRGRLDEALAVIDEAMPRVRQPDELRAVRERASDDPRRC